MSSFSRIHIKVEGREPEQSCLPHVHHACMHMSKDICQMTIIISLCRYPIIVVKLLSRITLYACDNREFVCP